MSILKQRFLKLSMVYLYAVINENQVIKIHFKFLTIIVNPVP